MPPRVLFVSKPIVPPFRDGTKCLVRDVALHLERLQPVVMTTRGAPPLEQVATRLPAAADSGGYLPVLAAPAYARDGGYAPAFADNARAAAYLLARARADVFHFVFAPNRRTSRVARWLRRVRRVPVVQTIASPPRDFATVSQGLFGDVIVAQSRWTAMQIRKAFAPEPGPRVDVIPPPLGAISQPTEAAKVAQRRELGIEPGVPVFVYPGDLEVSGGAEAVGAMVQPVVRELPGAVFVFACRAKTATAPLVARALGSRLPAEHVRFTSDPGNLLALLADATAVLFPVDDLWGKVDLPIVLLESMQLGAPVIAYDLGPLRELGGVKLVTPHEPELLVRTVLELARRGDERDRVVAAQRAAIQQQFSAPVVARAYEQVYARLLGGAESG